MITEPQQVGEELKQYFTDIGRPSQDNFLNLQLQRDSKFKTHGQLAHFNNITTAHLNKIIHSIPPKNSYLWHIKGNTKPLPEVNLSSTSGCHKDFSHSLLFFKKLQEQLYNHSSRKVMNLMLETNAQYQSCPL